MRKAALLVSILLSGCAEGDRGVINVPTFDSAPVDSGAAGDSTTAADSVVADTTSDDVGTDASMPDTTVPDTAMPDTAMPDTAMPDTAMPDTAVADTGPIDAGPPWTHTIAIDGTNDFTATSEKFTTTSTGYDAYVTWDDTNVYVGYSGPDIGLSASAEKWLFVYIDVDPGMGTGRSSAERYNTQAPTFPTGFGAEYYARFRTDNLDRSIKRWDGSSWTFVTTTMNRAKNGAYVELVIPRATIGSTVTKFGLVTFMLNEVGGGEWTYAGLYSGNFTDGYSTAKPLTKYLLVDTTSALPPNASARMAP